MRICERLPRLSTFNVLILCVLLTLVIFVGVINRIRLFIFPLRLGGTNDVVDSMILEETKPPLQPVSSLRVVAPGENIQVGDLEVHISTAVYSEHYPAKYGFNVFMNGWARHNTSMSFRCCLLRSLPNGALVDDIFIEVKSYTYHIYDQWIVDMQNAEFSCSISKKQIETIGDADFSHVTFAKDSCLHVPGLVMKIIYPTPNSVGICLKIAYGRINVENMVEWFEYARLMGVSKVFTYYFDLTPQAMTVMEYYQNIGFLDIVPIHPAVQKGGHKRGFKRPRFEQQAWVDEVVAANDCKHRMAKFEYVIILDMDEFIVPKGELTTYYDILKAATKQIPNVCGFSFDSHVVMLDWGPTRVSPLQVCMYTNRTTEPNYDGSDKNTRWAFRPAFTYWVQNNLVHCRKPHKTAPVPSEMYVLFHYRKCKYTWTGCAERQRDTDRSMLKYELPLVDRILRLPLTNLLRNHDKYVYSMIDWRKNYRRYVRANKLSVK